ncbi:MAG: ribonuclease III [Kiritimatiellae bacterium]|nr:ribonuclease III [Kiritimatiellia bacterium]
MAINGDSYKPFEAALGYTFKDKGLLRTALTNPSYRSDHSGQPDAEDNQRLEFLGDAVFGLLSAEQVYFQHSREDEGKLTIRRSHLASGVALAKLARNINLGHYLRLGNGEERTGGRNKDKFLTDAMEAVFGAAWCDGGLEAVRAIYSHLDVGSHIPSLTEVMSENPKGKLQEFCQQRHWGNPVYSLLNAQGPSHRPVYTVRVQAKPGETADASAGSKHQAEALAAEKLLRLLEKNHP